MREYLFGEIVFIGAGAQVYPSFTPSAIVRRVDDVHYFANDDEADDYMVENNYDGYLCPETYKGRIIRMGDYVGTV
jgi:hypothetical protein